MTISNIDINIDEFNNKFLIFSFVNISLKIITTYNILSMEELAYKMPTKQELKSTIENQQRHN